MLRRTVSEAQLVSFADEMQQFCDVMQQRLEDVATQLRQLDEVWDGVAFDAFVQRLQQWQVWAKDMGDDVRAMHRNAHIAHRNYTHNDDVNTSMWSG